MVRFNKKILVIDDEILIRDVVREFFEIEGYTVIGAQDGQEALRILENETFMVIFLDLKLPDITGAELCKQIRKSNPLAMIYAFTGYTNYYNQMDCRTAGFDDFIVKPVDMGMLLKAVQDAFKKIESRKANESGLP